MAENRIELIDPKAYIAGLNARVGNRDPFDVLAETPASLQALVNAHDAALFSRRPFEGKWTPAEVLGHLLDVEFVFGYRVRAIWCDDHPTIIGIDQDKWTARQQHNARQPGELLADFTAVRTINLRLYRSIPQGDYSRTGRHNERGEERLGDMLHYIAGHDLSHIEQISRYLAAARQMG